MPEEILRLANYSADSVYGYKLDNINLSVYENEIVAIVSDNSVAQDAFVLTLSGFKEERKEDIPGDITGDVYYKGVKQKKGYLKQGANSETAFCFKKNNFISYISVAENILFYSFKDNSRFGIFPRRKIRERAAELLEELRISLDVKSKVADLSKEDKQLVKIAKTFAYDPKLVIMHEPTEKLNNEETENLFRILKKIKSNNGSVIYVTRNWEEAIKIADTIYILQDGKIKNRYVAEEVIKDSRKFISDLYGYKSPDLNSEESTLEREVLDSVFKAAELLTSEYELKDALLFLAESVVKTMNADGVRIDLLDFYTRTIIDTYSYSEDSSLEYSVNKDFIIDFTESDTLYYDNIFNPGFKELFLNSGNVQSAICIPLRIRTRVDGVITILYKTNYLCSENDKKYLMAFAQQAALSIEDTRLLGRSALLQESHHRIKNNLNAINSYIMLQKGYVENNPDFDIIKVLDDITIMIKSIAAVHDLLSKEHLGRSLINVKSLLNKIAEYINLDKSIRFEVDFEDMIIPYTKATSVALVVNELLCNCIKHAFDDSHKLEKVISVKGKRLEDEVIISIKDNGKGFSEGFSLDNAQSLGLSIVKSIINNEFAGSVNIKNDGGACVEVRLKSDRLFIVRE